MKCSICGEKMTKGIRKYPQREQLERHIEIKHPETMRIVKKFNLELQKEVLKRLQG